MKANFEYGILEVEGESQRSGLPSNAKHHPLWAAVTICGSGGYFLSLKIVKHNPTRATIKIQN